MGKISTVSMSREEWLSARRMGIGGSDVGAILGLNPYRSPVAVYLDKIGEILQPELNSERVYWGNVLEDVVARHYAAVNDVRVQKNNRILSREDLPFMIANIDRDVFSPHDGRYGFEAKTTDARNIKDWTCDDIETVPINYTFQVQHYMAVTGYPMFDVGCLVGGNRYVQRRVLRDEEIIECITEKEKEFWHMVETRTPPAWDGSQSAWDVLKLLYPQSERGKIISLPQELEDALFQYQRLDTERLDLSAQTKAIEKQCDIYKQEICAALGDAEVGMLNGVEISYKTVHRKGYTTKDTEYRSFKIRDAREKGEAA
ncbi:MAG: YqaJ viral recombinase family protein [Tannerellaceae bacterium]